MVVLNKDTIDKIIGIFDIEFDVIFYNSFVDEKAIGSAYNNIKKKLKDIE